MNIIEHKIIGNYEAKIRLVNTHSTFSARIYFSGDRNIDKAGFLDISQDNFSIGRTIDGKENICAELTDGDKDVTKRRSKEEKQNAKTK